MLVYQRVNLIRKMLKVLLKFSPRQDTFGASFRHGAWLMALSGQEARWIMFLQYVRMLYMLYNAKNSMIMFK